MLSGYKLEICGSCYVGHRCWSICFYYILLSATIWRCKGKLRGKLRLVVNKSINILLEKIFDNREMWVEAAGKKNEG